MPRKRTWRPNQATGAVTANVVEAREVSVFPDGTVTVDGIVLARDWDWNGTPEDAERILVALRGKVFPRCGNSPSTP